MLTMDGNISENSKVSEKTTALSIPPAAPKPSNAKPRNRNAKKNVKKIESSPKKTPKSSNKGKAKKRSAFNKSIYRYHFQRTKPKLRRLLEANEVLKDELDRKTRDMTVLCGDIHNLLERLEPYVSANTMSNNTDTKTSLNSSKKKAVAKAAQKPKPVAKATKRKSTPEKSPKRSRKAGNDKLNNSLTLDASCDDKIKLSEFICNGDGIEKLKVSSKEQSPVCPDIQFISHQSQQILDDFMMLESPFFSLKRNDTYDGMNDHDTCNGSLNIIPLLKEPLEDTSSMDRRCSLELSSEASSADSLSLTTPNTTFLKQMKSHLSFFIPSDMDHQLVSLNPDKLPPTLPDDIFSET